MIPKNIFVLVNLVSGKKKAPKALKLLKESLEDEGLNYEVFFTQKERNGWQTVEQELKESFTDLIILGGDGTLNEAINGLKYDIPVGIIPCGSGNDYVKCLDLGKTLKDQVKTSIYGSIKKVDLGICNDRKFLNGVGIGFDGQIVADLVTQKTWIQGAAKYYYHVLKILSSYKAQPFHFHSDAVENKKSLILLCIAKGTTFGGAFKLVPDAKLDDGKLHICEIGDLKPIKRFLNISRLGNGTHIGLKEVGIHVAEKINIEGHAHLHAHIDGEYFGNPPFEFGVLKKELSIRVKS
ncbi:MAG: YegS/Rv2252/BmrU family lipid kinase [Cyclobacteriaceae bacterium]